MNEMPPASPSLPSSSSSSSSSRYYNTASASASSSFLPLLSSSNSASRDLRLCCRLISLQSRVASLPPRVRSTIYIGGGNPYQLHCIASCDIGNNVKCTLYLEGRNEDHLYIAFNWFNPQGYWDMAKLSYHFATKTSISQAEPNLDVTTYSLEQSQKLFWHPQVQQALQRYVVGGGGGGGGGFSNDLQDGEKRNFFSSNHRDIGYEKARNESTSRSSRTNTTNSISSSSKSSGNYDVNRQVTTNSRSRRRGGDGFLESSSSSSVSSSEGRGGVVSRITCTGFSQGAAFAHIFAYQLVENLRVFQSVRVVALGSPLFCGRKFCRWYEKNLRLTSINVVLTAKEGFSRQPKFSSGQSVGAAAAAAAGSSSPQRKKGVTEEGVEENGPLPSSPACSMSTKRKISSNSSSSSSETGLIYDPICVRGIIKEEVEIPPNAYKLLDGTLSPITSIDIEAMKREEEKLNANSYASLVWHLLPQWWLFSSEYHRCYDKLHSVLAYYEDITAMDQVNGNSQR